MGKFAISCNKCGNYVTAYNGLRGLFHNSVNCTCGNTIDVRSERMTAAECPHCGNSVVYDQGKDKKTVCPVCHKLILPGEGAKIKKFHCPQCGVGLSATEGTNNYTCPVCDFEIDVPAQMAKQKIKDEGLISVIKYEGDNNTFVWKHPAEDFNLGTQLIVHESQEAIFFRDGQALDLFGPGRYTLETQNLPVLNGIYKLPTGDTSPFHSEVYFINQTVQMGIKWGTDSKVGLFDPASGMHIEIGASGEFNLRVFDSRKVLLKLVGTEATLSRNDLLSTNVDESEILATGGEQLNTGTNGVSGNSRSSTNVRGYFRSMIMTQVKSFLASTIREQKISILEIDEHLSDLSKALKNNINTYLESYGLTMPEFFISRIVTPDDDPNFRQMKQLYADQYLKVRKENVLKAEAEAAAERKTVEAQTAAKMKIISAQGEAEAYRLKAEAEAAEMKMKGYTYQQETVRQVGKEAMKNGISGTDGSGGIGGILDLGIGFGAMSSVAGMTRESLNPVMNQAQNILTPTENTNSDTWNCQCGRKGITFNFCPDCGARKPEQSETWDCSCGTKNITFNFCPNCGAKKPEKPETWDCSCGHKGITFKFCPNCGQKKGE